jgi:hypothetical protein
MIVITLARKPVETSVARNVRKHGTGGLNIDGTRLRFTSENDKWNPSTSKHPIYKGYMDGSGEDYTQPHHRPTLLSNAPHTGGRWPANLILQHKSTCLKVGTRQVKCGVSGADGRGFRSEYVGGEPKDWDRAITMTYNGPDGTETMEAWECSPDCPVGEMDGQSGERPSSLTGRADPSLSHGHPGTALAKEGVTYMAGKTPGTTVYADSGGASRFFKVVGT